MTIENYWFLWHLSFRLHPEVGLRVQVVQTYLEWCGLDVNQDGSVSKISVWFLRKLEWNHQLEHFMRTRFDKKSTGLDFASASLGLSSKDDVRVVIPRYRSQLFIGMASKVSTMSWWLICLALHWRSTCLRLWYSIFPAPRDLKALIQVLLSYANFEGFE